MSRNGWIALIVLVGSVSILLGILYIARERIREKYASKNNPPRERKKHRLAEAWMKRLKKTGSYEFWLDGHEKYKELNQEMKKTPGENKKEGSS